jgi:hypothetical protein
MSLSPIFKNTILFRTPIEDTLRQSSETILLLRDE